MLKNVIHYYLRVKNGNSRAKLYNKRFYVVFFVVFVTTFWMTYQKLLISHWQNKYYFYNTHVLM